MITRLILKITRKIDNSIEAVAQFIMANQLRIVLLYLVFVPLAIAYGIGFYLYGGGYINRFYQSQRLYGQIIMDCNFIILAWAWVVLMLKMFRIKSENKLNENSD